MCASVDVQCHKPIYHLTSKDLERTSPINGKPVVFLSRNCLDREESSLVILAPYGINGMLIGPINREMDAAYFRDNWEKNYPIRHLDNLPDFVEVSIGIAETWSRFESNLLSFFRRKCSNVLSHLLCI